MLRTVGAALQTDGKKEKLFVPRQRLKTRLVAALGSYLAWFVMHLLFFTCKKQIFGQDVWDDQMRKNGCKALGAGWHRGIIYIIFHFRNIGGAIMTSRSTDGELGAQLIKRFGYTSPRGSNTTGGREALDEFVSSVNSGKPGGLAVDAPKGPPYVSKHGIIAAASRTGAVICPFSWYAEPNIRIGSWDRTMIPKPFCRLVAVFDREPILVPLDAGYERQEELRQELDNRLNRLTYQTDHWFALCGQYSDPRDIPVPEPVPLPYHPPREKSRDDRPEKGKPQ
ncbi:MAG: lysophospholipid acyltransferase family protein [Syntrophales bacterium]